MKFDRAIHADSPFISWTSATEYQREIGLPIGGSGNAILKKRSERVAGLMFNIQRKADGAKQDITYLIIERSYLCALPRLLDIA